MGIPLGRYYGIMIRARGDSVSGTRHNGIFENRLGLKKWQPTERPVLKFGGDCDIHGLRHGRCIPGKLSTTACVTAHSDSGPSREAVAHEIGRAGSKLKMNFNAGNV